MNTDATSRYQELQRYVGWSDDDAVHLASVGDAIQPYFASLIEDFYSEIARHPAAQQVITGGEAQVARLKQTLRQWLTELFSGIYDSCYVARRWEAGHRHVEIGLNQFYANAALARLRRGLTAALEVCLAAEPHRLAAVRESLNMLIDLDLAIIEDAYQTESVARQQAHEQLLQAERLSAIGQMMAGLAHESRNALQRSQACLEMLGLEIKDRPAALDLLGRLQRAQDDLYQLYEEVRDYAAPIRLHRAAHDLRPILEESWEHLAGERSGRDTQLEIHSGAGRPVARVDRFALARVFRNILENALSACRDPVRVVVRFRACRLGDRPALELSVADNGPGLTAESREKIFEPFFTTKTKGTGLGMAISRRIVEAHGGRIAVGTDCPGAEIIVTLPDDELHGDGP